MCIKVSLEVLETKRTFIRPISEEDVGPFFMYKSNRNANKHQGWTPVTIEDAQAFIAKNPKELNTPNTWFQLVIIEKTTNTLIGDIGVHFLEEDNPQCELGYTIAPKYQSQGFATEAVREVIDYLFTFLHKHRITASIDPENTSSIKLIEKLSFRLEGHFKKSLHINGVWVDDLVYSILRAEWSRNKINTSS